MADIARLPASGNRGWLEPYRHADMAARKSEPLVKSLRIDAGVMGQQLDQLATLGARLRDRPLHELFADAAAAAMGGDTDILDQPARGALRAQARQDAKLQTADDCAALALGDHEPDVRIGIEPIERLGIAGRQWIFDPFARAAQ